MKWFLPVFLFAIASAFTAFIVRTYTANDFELINSGWPALFGGLIGGLVGSLTNTSPVQKHRGPQIAADSRDFDPEPIRSLWAAPITWVALVVAIGMTAIAQLS